MILHKDLLSMLETVFNVFFFFIFFFFWIVKMFKNIYIFYNNISLYYQFYLFNTSLLNTTVFLFLYF